MQEEENHTEIHMQMAVLVLEVIGDPPVKGKPDCLVKGITIIHARL